MVAASTLGTPRPEPGGAPGSPAGGSAHRRSPAWLIAACLGALALPLLVALAGFRRQTWTPVLDLAMTELRVRDVGGRHTPLIGLPGRIGTLEQQGSHPGPLSFYALAPTYRLLGSTAWALQVATVVVHLVAMGVSLWIGARRAGRTGVLSVAAGLALLIAAYGGGTLTEPWNPYLPLLWWVVVLLAAWSVLVGDLPMLPVAVLAASFCAQTHVPYLLLALGIGALAVAGLVLGPGARPRGRAVTARWVAGSALLGVVLWLPPTVDQLRRDPGNYATLIEHFTSPDEDVEGLAGAVGHGLEYLDVAQVVRGNVANPGWTVVRAERGQPSAWRGAVVLLLWLAAAALTRRLRLGGTVGALHLVVGAALVLMVLSISRIFGEVWFYLGLWGWAIGLLAVAATAATGWEWHRARQPDRSLRARPAALAAVVLGVALVARFALAAWDSPHADAAVAAQLAGAVDDVEAGLLAGVGAADGRAGRYLVTWSDALHIGSQGFGLLSELERRGFEVGVPASKRVPATAHRTLAPEEATAQVRLATGSFVAAVSTIPGAARVALVDERTAQERREQAALLAEAEERLEGLGLDELVPRLEDNLFGAAIDVRLPEDLRLDLGRVLEIGQPLAVFVLPPGAPVP